MMFQQHNQTLGSMYNKQTFMPSYNPSSSVGMHVGSLFQTPSIPPTSMTAGNNSGLPSPLFASAPTLLNPDVRTSTSAPYTPAVKKSDPVSLSSNADDNTPPVKMTEEVKAVNGFELHVLGESSKNTLYEMSGLKSLSFPSWSFTDPSDALSSWCVDMDPFPTGPYFSHTVVNTFQCTFFQGITPKDLIKADIDFWSPSGNPVKSTSAPAGDVNTTVTSIKSHSLHFGDGV